MLELMKTLHLFGLMAAAAGGMGTAMVAAQAKRGDGLPSPALIALRKNFGLAALVGILLLWATGLWMWLVDFDGAMLGVAFALKIIAAALVLAIIVGARIARARTTPGTPPPAFVQRLGPLSGLLAFIAVALAVVVFK